MKTEPCKEYLKEMPYSSEHIWNADIHGIPFGPCLKCGMPIQDWNAKTMTHMPQEPQSETPINKLVLHGKLVDISTGKDVATGWYWVSDTDYKTLERELGEAKRDANNCRQIIDTYSRQEDDLLKIQQELAQVLGEVELLKKVRHPNGTLAKLNDLTEERDLLAKQNHQFKIAASSKIDYDQENQVPVCNCCGYELDSAGKCHAKDCLAELILGEPDLSSLTVLTRAEVEKWECECKWKETNNCFGDKELIGDKCPRCTILERFTK